MNEPEHPVRWLEQPHDLPPELAAALAAYEDRAPTAADRAAIFAALQARLPVEAAGAPGLSARRWLRSLAGLGGLAAVLAVLVHMHTPAQRTEHAAPAVPSSTAKPETRARSEPAASAPQAPASPSAAPGPPPRTPEISDPGAELSLLTPARRVLSSDPARSLALAAEHARRFPRGAFAEERDLLRIEALLRSGQRPAAARHARRFRLTYPRSAHLQHLAESLAP